MQVLVTRRIEHNKEQKITPLNPPLNKGGKQGGLILNKEGIQGGLPLNSVCPQSQVFCHSCGGRNPEPFANTGFRLKPVPAGRRQEDCRNDRDHRLVYGQTLNKGGKEGGYSPKRVGGLVLCSALYAMCFLLIFIQGCGPDHFVRPETDVEPIKKIAILPFENFTSDEYAGEKIRRLVITELLSREKDVIEPGEVTHLLKEMQVRSLRMLTVEDMQNIGRTLGAGGVMMGAVEAFGISRGISVNYPEVTVNMRMIEVSSGEVIWSVRHTSGGPGFWTRHFGSEGPSLSETARRVVKEAIGTLF